MEIEEDINDEYDTNDSVEDNIRNSFEPFESDGDSMLLLGQPIDAMLTIKNTTSFDPAPNSRSESSPFLSKYDYLRESSDDQSYDYESFESDSQLNRKGGNVKSNISNENNNFNNGNEMHPSGTMQEFSAITLVEPINSIDILDNKTNSTSTFTTTTRKNFKKKIHKKKVIESSIAEETASFNSSGYENQTEKSKKTKHLSSSHGEIPPIGIRISSQSVVSSTIAKEMKHHPSMIQKQLTNTIKKMEYYRKQNDYLLQKLDESKVMETISKYRNDMIEKSKQIEMLTNENLALRQITRHQTKFLIEKSIEHDQIDQDDEDVMLSNEKQVEILLIQIKKLNNKLRESREKERKTLYENEAIKKKNFKLNQKIIKLNYFIEKMKEKKNQREEGENEGDGGDDRGEETEKIEKKLNEKELNGKKLSEKRLTIDRLKEIIHQLERSLRIQRDGYHRGINQHKLELLNCQEDNRKLEMELERREVHTKQQMMTLKQLRIAYDELLESSKHLQHASEMYSRDQPPPSTSTWNEPKPPVQSKPSSRPSSNQSPRVLLRPKTGVLHDEDDVEGVDQGGNSFFLTSARDI